MRDFRELNEQVNEVKRMLDSFIQKLTAQVENLLKLISYGLSNPARFPVLFHYIPEKISSIRQDRSTVALFDSSPAFFPRLPAAGHSAILSPYYGIYIERKRA